MNLSSEEDRKWTLKTGGAVKRITLRDYFAAKAMPLVWSMCATLPDYKIDIATVAARSYAVADAMLEQRRKP
jgi:hypothetical protein